jgi:hypothetical protein
MMGTTRYYRHFKGGKYKVLAIGQDSESLAPVVVYQALYGDHKVWVRPKDMFDGVVETCQGTGTWQQQERDVSTPLDMTVPIDVISTKRSAWSDLMKWINAYI